MANWAGDEIREITLAEDEERAKQGQTTADENKEYDQLSQKVVMEAIDPDQALKNVSGAAQNIAAEKAQKQTDEKKSTRERFLNYILMLQGRLEVTIRKLENEIASLQAEQDADFANLEEIDKFLQDFEDNGNFEDKQAAIDFLEQITGEEISDDISAEELQILLKKQENGIRKRTNNRQENIDDKQDHINDLRKNKDKLYEYAKELEDPDKTPEEIEALESEAGDLIRESELRLKIISNDTNKKEVLQEIQDQELAETPQISENNHSFDF